jgi:hypothetical protein
MNDHSYGNSALPVATPTIGGAEIDDRRDADADRIDRADIVWIDVEEEEPSAIRR